MNASDFKSITAKVAKKWTKQRKAEERSNRSVDTRMYMYSSRVNQTDIARQVIPGAYTKASDSGRLPAHARQIFYAARKEIQDRTGRPLNSQYFTQTLLPKFMNENAELTAGWWVVFDARGHLLEPHTSLNIPLGTLEVDRYLSEVRRHTVEGLVLEKAFDSEYPTRGPKHRYQAILFIEKEGFNPLFKEIKLAERYDIAIMSTKGESVVAARHLVDELCHDDVPVLVLHDFDKEGFLISKNLTEVSLAARPGNRVRYEFTNEVNVIDLGLRLGDVERWDLEPESVRFKGGFDRDSIATKEEQKFLRFNRRVELNAFTSADFIAWIESKLDEHGIKKAIPDAETLESAYRRSYQIACVNSQLEQILEDAAQKAQAARLPRSLSKKISDAVADSSEQPWDEIIAELAKSRFDEGK